MKKGILQGAITVVGAATIAYGVKKIIDDLDNLENQVDQEIFDELIKKQEVFDCVDGSMLIKWFQEKQQLHPEENMGVLAEVTQKNADMFGFGKIPEGFDSEHVLYQAVIEKESCKTLESRLLSFCSLSSVVRSKLEGKDYIFFT